MLSLDRNITTRFCLSLGTLILGSQAMAIDLQFLGTGEGRNLQISTNSGSSFSTVFGGELRMKEVSPTLNFTAFCADPKTGMISGPFGTSELDSDVLGSRGLRAGYLINKYAPSIFNLPVGNERKDKALALQVALWEVLVDGSTSPNISGGSFRARNTDGSALNGNVANLVSNYLSDNGSDIARYYKSNLNSSGKPISQAVLTPVPEPGTMLALAAGLAAFARKRRNKK
jgi:hypothetical protein